MGMKNPKFWVAVLTLAAVSYALFAVWRAWALFVDGSVYLRLFAIAIVVIPVLGLSLIIREINFGISMQRMGQQLAREGGLPLDNQPRTASGRVVREAADARFAELAERGAPRDWREWFHIAIAYEDARDRKRARAAMRNAEKLFRAEPSQEQ